MQVKVFMIPKNHEYIMKMTHSLESIGVAVKILKPFHWSTFSNILNILKFRRKGYRIVHVHWLYIFPMAVVMKLFYHFCNLLGIKIVWEMHNILPHGHKEADRKNGKWFYEKVDAIIFHSNADVERARKLLRTNYEQRKIIIPHGNFNESYENNITREEARKLLNIPESKRVILCFGFIRSNRGYKYLLEATADMDDTVVLIVGKIWHQSTYKELLEHKARDNKIRLITGWIPDEKVQVYFNACDIVVLPYTDITTSGVIPLAYSFSRPVVASAIGGIKEVINGKTGMLVPPRNSSALRDAIEQMFKRDLAAMGKDAHRYAETEFSWETNACKVKELYRSLL